MLNQDSISSLVGTISATIFAVVNFILVSCNYTPISLQMWKYPYPMNYYIRVNCCLRVNKVIGPAQHFDEFMRRQDVRQAFDNAVTEFKLDSEEKKIVAENIGMILD